MKLLFLLLPFLLFSDVALKSIALTDNHSASPRNRLGIQAYNLEIPGDFADLRNCLTPFLGTPLTSEQIELIKLTISNFYRLNNHPLLTVGVPNQDITDGHLQLILIESTLGQVRSTGNKWFSDSLLYKAIRIKPNEPIIADTLIEDIAWLNRNPFRSTDLIFTPGAEINTTDIELYTKDRLPLRFYLGGDNTGTEITGRARFFTGVDWAWTFLFDQILSYQFTTSADFHKLLSHTGHYTGYLPWRHILILYGGYASTRPHIPSFHSTGYNAQGSLRYQMPITIPPTAFFLQPTLGLDYKLQKTNLIFAGESDIFVSGGLAAVSQIMIGNDLAWEIPHHKVLFQWLFFWSPGDIFPHQSTADFNALRIGAVPNYLYTLMTLSYRYDSSYGTLWFQGRGQKSTKALLQSEEFALGGYDTVRGYDEREYLADNGICLNLEFRAPTLSFFSCRKYRDEWTFLAFFDYGLGVNQLHTIDEQKSAYLLGIGPGVRFAVSPYFTFRADYGFKLHKLHFGDSSLGKLHLGALLSY